MTIKIQCDQCGNLVNQDAYHQYNVYDQTPERLPPAQAYAIAMNNAQNSIGAGQAGQLVQHTKPRNFEVHLCPTCYPIWFERVKKLTEHTK